MERMNPLKAVQEQKDFLLDWILTEEKRKSILVWMSNFMHSESYLDEDENGSYFRREIALVERVFTSENIAEDTPPFTRFELICLAIEVEIGNCSDPSDNRELAIDSEILRVLYESIEYEKEDGMMCIVAMWSEKSLNENLQRVVKFIYSHVDGR